MKLGVGVTSVGHCTPSADIGEKECADLCRRGHRTTQAEYPVTRLSQHNFLFMPPKKQPSSSSSKIKEDKVQHQNTILDSCSLFIDDSNQHRLLG